MKKVPQVLTLPRYLRAGFLMVSLGLMYTGEGGSE